MGKPRAVIRDGSWRRKTCADDAGPARVGPAREGETDRGQGRAQPLGPPAVPSGQATYLLDERATSAFGVPAGEPANPQLEYDTSSRTRNIRRKPQVGTVMSYRE